MTKPVFRNSMSSGCPKTSTGKRPVNTSSPFASKRQVTETPLKFVPGCFADKNGWMKNHNFEETA